MRIALRAPSERVALLLQLIELMARNSPCVLPIHFASVRQDSPAFALYDYFNLSRLNSDIRRQSVGPRPKVERIDRATIQTRGTPLAQ